MALKFDIYILMFVNTEQPVENVMRLPLTAICKRGGQRTFIATCKTNQPLSVFLKFIESCGTFSLCFFAEFERSYKLAQILIALLRCAQESYSRRLIYMYLRQPSWRPHSICKIADTDFCTDMCSYAALLRHRV